MICICINHDTGPAAGGGGGIAPPAAKPLKRLKTAMASYSEKLAWIWGWRHVRLGLEPRELGIVQAVSGEFPRLATLGFATSFPAVRALPP